MIRLYDFTLSGNSYKVRLLLSLLKLNYELVPVNLREGEQKSPEFLQLNPFGQVPVITDGEIVMRDSQAILVYLARRYGGEDWLPTDAESLSKVTQWLSTAANDIANSFAVARVYFLFNRQLDVTQAQQKAYAILHVIDDRLKDRNWLEVNRPTIADIACFPYIGLAADGKISLEAYPRVIAWIERIKNLPGYISMPGL